MKTFGEILKAAEHRWVLEELARRLRVSSIKIRGWEKESNFPESVITVANTALLLGISPRFLIRKWLDEMNKRYSQEGKKRFDTGEIGLYLICAIAKTGVKSLREFAQQYSYQYQNLRNWIRGVSIPSSKNRTRLSQDLEDVDLDNLERICRRAIRHPSRLALLVLEARGSRGISLSRLEQMGFPRGAMWHLETRGEPPYSIASEKFFKLPDALGIPRLVALVAYLRDNIDRGASELNLSKIELVSAKILFWLALLKGINPDQPALTPRQLAISAHFQKKKMEWFMGGRYVPTAKEKDALLNFLEADEGDRNLFNAAWEREFVSFQRERVKMRQALREMEARLRKVDEPRILEEIYSDITGSVPLDKILTEKEKNRLELHFRRGRIYDDIGDMEGVSRASAHRSVMRALRKINEWREKNP